MTALELKNELAKEFLLTRHHAAVFTESFMFFNADFVSITGSWYSSEFEIKISKSDLRKEAEMIKMAREWIDSSSLSGKKISSYNKLMKHRHYLALDNPKIVVPNEFSFYVPEELEEEAIKAVEGTPYGVMLTYKSVSNPYWDGHIRKDRYYWAVKPQRLHKNKLNDADKVRVMRKVSTEAYYLREKLIIARNGGSNESNGSQSLNVGSL